MNLVLSLLQLNIDRGRFWTFWLEMKGCMRVDQLEGSRSWTTLPVRDMLIRMHLHRPQRTSAVSKNDVRYAKGPGWIPL